MKTWIHAERYLTVKIFVVNDRIPLKKNFFGGESYSPYHFFFEIGWFEGLLYIIGAKNANLKQAFIYLLFIAISHIIRKSWTWLLMTILMFWLRILIIFHIVLIISYKIKTIYKILKDSETKDVIKMLKPCARLSPPCQPVNNKFVTQY